LYAQTGTHTLGESVAPRCCYSAVLSVPHLAEELTLNRANGEKGFRYIIGWSERFGWKALLLSWTEH